MLNFINYYLQQYPEEEKPKIIRFNPWWFSGREDLTRMLIGQIGASLGKKDWSRIKNLFANFSELISNIPIKGTEIGKFISNKLREQPDIQGLKEKIGELLLEKNQKIFFLPVFRPKGRDQFSDPAENGF